MGIDLTASAETSSHSPQDQSFHFQRFPRYVSAAAKIWSPLSLVTFSPYLLVGYFFNYIYIFIILFLGDFKIPTKKAKVVSCLDFRQCLCLVGLYVPPFFPFFFFLSFSFLFFPTSAE